MFNLSICFKKCIFGGKLNKSKTYLFRINLIHTGTETFVASIFSGSFHLYPDRPLFRRNSEKKFKCFDFFKEYDFKQEKSHKKLKKNSGKYFFSSFENRISFTSQRDGDLW